MTNLSIGQRVNYSLWHGTPKTDKGVVIGLTPNGWIKIETASKSADGINITYNVRRSFIEEA